MGFRRLVGSFVCGIYGINLICFAWSELASKNCQSSYKYSYIFQYDSYAACPYNEQVCNGWFLGKRCTTYTKYYRCVKKMSRVDFAYQYFDVCCPGYIELNNGTCLRGCAEGKYGTECERDCNCQGHAYPGCDIDTGNCTCLPGWTGSDCNKVCPNGWFGSNCSSECLCKNNATCSPIGGACNCTTPGWTGQFCQEECNSTRFGRNCQENCTCGVNETCSRFDGLCACIAGKTGVNCSEDCPAYRFGPNCTNSCSCAHSTGCDAVTGKCICDVGYTGEQCNEVCSSGTYGAGCNQTCNCTGAEVCEPDTGECISRCVCHEEGTANCNSLYDSCRCLPYHNHTCHDENVFLKERCRDVCECSSPTDTCCVSNSSMCQCKDGWTGRKCSTACPQGTFGRKCYGICNCSADELCHHVSGNCISLDTAEAQISAYPRKGYIFWIFCGIIFVLLVALTTGLAIYLRRLRPIPKVTRNHSPCKDMSCCECFKPHNKRASITRRYTELHEDLSWVTSDSDYDHLSRPGQAKSELQIDFDPTYNRTSETGDEYGTTALPRGSNIVTSEDEYSHIKGNEQAANSIYDTLQRTKVQVDENVYSGDNSSVIF